MLVNFLKKTYSAVPFKVGIYSFIKSLVPLPEKIYKHLHFKGIITVPVNKEKKFYFKLKSNGVRIENEIFWGGITSWYEGVSMKYWIKLSESSQYVFDVGAYHGIYSMVAGSVSRNIKVFAFEPVENSYHKLLNNIRLNNFNIQAFNCGVSDKDGAAEFYNIDAPGSLIGSMHKESFQHGETIFRKTINVRSLKSIIEEFHIPKIDLIKIDVEGHEYEVIQGMGEYLKIHKPSMLFEVLNEERALQLNALLSDCGYLYFDIDEINPPRQIPYIKKSSCYNILVCTPDHARQLDLI